MSNTQNQKEQKLEALLQSRRLEPVSPGLAERIVRKAQLLPQHQTDSLVQWVRELFTDFHLPRPAYVLVCILIFGFVVGSILPRRTVPQDDGDSLLVHSVLYEDEDIL